METALSNLSFSIEVLQQKRDFDKLNNFLPEWLHAMFKLPLAVFLEKEYFSFRHPGRLWNVTAVWFDQSRGNTELGEGENNANTILDFLTWFQAARWILLIYLQEGEAPDIFSVNVTTWSSPGYYKASMWNITWKSRAREHPFAKLELEAMFLRQKVLPTWSTAAHNNAEVFSTSGTLRKNKYAINIPHRFCHWFGRPSAFSSAAAASEYVQGRSFGGLGEALFIS